MFNLKGNVSNYGGSGFQIHYYENIRFSACSFKVKTIALKQFVLRRQRRERKASGRTRGNRQSNLIIRNAPEHGNEGLSFRLTLSGRRCYSFVCPRCGTSLPSCFSSSDTSFTSKRFAGCRKSFIKCYSKDCAIRVEASLNVTLSKETSLIQEMDYESAMICRCIKYFN